MSLEIIKTEIKNERKKIASLKRKRKYQYIWDYYKLPIGIICFLLFFIGYMATIMNRSISDHWFYVAFVNTTKDLRNGSKLWDDYAEETGYDTKEALIDFNSDFYFDYLNNHAQGNKYYELFVAYIDAGTLDCAVMEKEALLSFGASGRFLDLDSDGCEKIKEKYGDRFLYVTPLDETYESSSVAVGIDISDSTLMSEYGIYVEGTECALGIGVFSEHPDAILAFLDLILEDE